MKAWTSQHAFTSISLFGLLAIRILVADPISNLGELFNISIQAPWMGILKTIRDSASYLLLSWSFVLVGLVIIANRSDLQDLNIDQAFLAIFGASSLTYWTYYREPSGWIAILIPFGLYAFYKKQEFKLVQVEPSAGLITIIAVVGFLSGLLLKHDSITAQNISWVNHLIATQVPIILVEEVIYRGLLWKFLRDIKWSAFKSIGFQAFLFWLSHAYYISGSFFFFWVIIPITSVILGIIVWRTRSLTVSSFAHIFFNYLLVLYQI